VFVGNTRVFFAYILCLLDIELRRYIALIEGKQRIEQRDNDERVGLSVSNAANRKEKRR
jgi:hypothetical protein